MSKTGLLIATAASLMSCVASNNKTYIVKLEAPATTTSIYGTFIVGGQALKMTIGTNAAYTAVVSNGCGTCGGDIKFTDGYSDNHALKTNVTITNRTQINPYLPGVNDRIFEGSVKNDKFCGSDKTACQTSDGMNFFEIKTLLSGFDLTSFGRLGIDYHPGRNKELPSFASYLKQQKIIDENLVTFSHNSFGDYRLTFGGYGNPDTIKDIEWFLYNRTYDEAKKDYSFRAMNLNNIAFSASSLVLGAGKIQAVVENNIPGLLYKVPDSKMIEAFRNGLSDALKTKVKTIMEGPMVKSFIID